MTIDRQTMVLAAPWYSAIEDDDRRILRMSSSFRDDNYYDFQVCAEAIHYEWQYFGNNHVVSLATMTAVCHHDNNWKNHQRTVVV